MCLLLAVLLVPPLFSLCVLHHPSQREDDDKPYNGEQRQTIQRYQVTTNDKTCGTPNDDKPKDKTRGTSNHICFYCWLSLALPGRARPFKTKVTTNDKTKVTTNQPSRCDWPERARPFTLPWRASSHRWNRPQPQGCGDDTAMTR